MRSLVIGLAGV